MSGIEIFKNPPFTWFVIGLVFALLELVVPGLVVIFFGIGAWVAALFSLIFKTNINVQILIFIIASIASLVLLRKYLMNKFFGNAGESKDALEDEFMGKIAVAESDIDPGAPGKVSFRGTLWTAQCDNPVKKGEQVKIINKDSITLIVKPKNLED